MPVSAHASSAPSTVQLRIVVAPGGRLMRWTLFPVPWVSFPSSKLPFTTWFCAAAGAAYIASQPIKTNDVVRIPLFIVCPPHASSSWSPAPGRPDKFLSAIPVLEDSAAPWGSPQSGASPMPPRRSTKTMRSSTMREEAQDIAPQIGKEQLGHEAKYTGESRRVSLLLEPPEASCPRS